MKMLSQMLGEIPLEKFLENNFTKLPFSYPHGAKKFTDLLNWEVVKNIINKKDSVLRIVQDGRVIKDYVEMNFDEASGFYQKGNTLLVRFAEKSDEKLREVCDEFAKAFHTPVDIQLYCTPEGHNAFGWHYDVEEVFIIQCEGSKTYTIRPNTWHPLPLVSSIPKDLGYENEKTPQQLTVTLEKGDWLYIPSGWWHIARTQKESMHISIGLMPSSAVDILEFAPKYLARSPFWRTRMPVHKEFKNEEEEIAFYQEALKKLGQHLGEELSSADFIRGFLKEKRSRHS
jgi:ribosomal protein L16 Arg81 hydroxylase